jgi:hypothetical protein
METHSFAPSFNLRRANLRRASGDPPSFKLYYVLIYESGIFSFSCQNEFMSTSNLPKYEPTYCKDFYPNLKWV